MTIKPDVNKLIKILTRYRALCHRWFADADSKDEEPEESGAFGAAKPMLPYSSMFLLGSTNP